MEGEKERQRSSILGGERWPGEGPPHGFSEAQMKVLASLCEALIPAIEIGDELRFRESEENVKRSVEAFYLASGAEPPLPGEVAQRIRKAPAEASLLMNVVLWALSTRLGTLALCGSICISSKFPFLRPFYELSVREREKVLQKWSRASFFWPIRMVFVLVKLLTFYNFFTRCDKNMNNPSWEAIGYNLPLRERSIIPPNREKPLDKGLIETSKTTKHSLISSLLAKGLHAFENKTTGKIHVDCDVIIVGSGCGGAVAAAVLSAAGHKVIILEKGEYFTAEDYTGNEGPSVERLYEQEGILSTDDGGVMILAGATVGGGSVVNWGACIETPADVLSEWAQQHKLPLFQSQEYISAMDTVCRRLSVTDNCPRESLPNRIMRRGCENLNIIVESVPRNSPEDHFCGSCSFGCPTQKKKSTDITWLVDAVDAGAVIVTGCKAEKFLLQKNNNNPEKKKRKCVGVAARGIDSNIELIIHSKISVSAGGALQTPVILQASGLKNCHVGRNLHLHPGLMAWGYFPEEEGKTFEGGVITTVHKVDDADDERMTAIIEAVMLGPGAFSVAMPWVDGQDFKERMRRYSKTVHLAVLVRDQGSGAVGRRIGYRLSGSDREVHRRGLRRALEILVAGGAAEVGLHMSNGASFKCKGASKEDLEEFLDGLGLANGPKSGGQNWVLYGTGHQMGSCRMGESPQEGAVDENGESWEVEGLFVCDASLFPTALGVNPMVTIQSISLCLSQRIAKSLSTTN